MVKRVRKIKRRRRVTPKLRVVPVHIERPPYAASGRPKNGRGSCLKTAEEIERMRISCTTARAVLEDVLTAVRPGITTDELDKIAHVSALDRGSYPSPLNYRGFPKSLCTSVNDVVCHGIPEDRTLIGGDIINCDVTVYINGMHGDCSETAFVGEVSPEARKLVEITYEAMMAGIAAVQPGLPLNVIAKAITKIVRPAGYSIVETFTGHGIGEQFHMSPQVLHYFESREVTPIKEGMTFTIEPMINTAGPDTKILSDGWTALTHDGGLSAQFEHTILVTAEGAEILTGADAVPFFKRA